MRTRMIVFATWLAAASAAAQDESDPRVAEARGIFDRGEQQFADGLYAEAAQSYEQAWTIMHDQMSPPHPRAHLVRYNWALAVERGGAPRRAAEIYRHYLDEGGSAEPNAAEVEARITALIHMEGGAPRGGGGISPVGPIVLAFGGAAVIAGAIVGGLALADGDALREDCPGLSNCDPSDEGRYETMRLMSGAADVLLFGGLAVAAVGVVLTLTITEGGSSEHAQIDVHLRANGAQLVGRF
jgi:hypothetical protein